MNNLLSYLNNNIKKYTTFFFIYKRNILNIKKIYFIFKYISCLSFNKKYCIKNNKCSVCNLFHKKKIKLYKKYNNRNKLISIFLLNFSYNIYFLENINTKLININKIKKNFILIKLKYKKNFDIINFILNLNCNKFLLNLYKIKYKILNLKKIYLLISFLIKSKKIKFINLYKFIIYYKFILIKNPNIDICLFYYIIQNYLELNSSL